MFCVKCGSSMESKDLFCPKCGAKVGGAEQSDIKPQSPTHTPQQIVVNGERRSSCSLGCLVVILIVVVLVVLAVGAVFLFSDELGITQTCNVPLCRNNAVIFRDMCSRCSDLFR